MKEEQIEKQIEKEERERIARTILHQVSYNKSIWFSWGSKKFIALAEQKMEEGYCLGGLHFTVNGLKVKGSVFIYLMANDTYMVHIINKEGKKVFEKENIYCDELQIVIDEVIEKQPEYKF